ncbi:MAG: asparagine synthase (glutamine-hydrolyzing) [Flavobacteriales bacterium]|nr:asparagine synthase (glutamine-hydrolyzing) [Flavobacteriales bacterium]
MCGITGIIFNEKEKDLSKEEIKTQVEKSVESLALRGPDSKGTFQDLGICLGHTRLSVIDPRYKASQPMTDETGQYTIVFNGEFYNYKIHRDILEKDGTRFYTQSDTEVLLHLYIKFGKNCLEKINGFFAFAIWDNWNRSIFIVRDRMGVKPLLWYANDSSLCFASEMKAMLAYNIPKKIDNASLFTYLQLNYIPAPTTIFEGVKKLMPGHYIFIPNIDQAEFAEVKPTPYYTIPTVAFNHKDLNPLSYTTAQETLIELLEEAVKKRLVSDVPLGAFLSGGIDSSVICALASRHNPNLQTFSVGYKDNPFFDETHYAELVAKKFGTQHTTFSLSENDFFDHVVEAMDYLDEPFGDSAYVNFYVLSKFTRDKIKVALSGDGADEMFAGYNKHFAEYQARNLGLKGSVISAASPLFNLIPQSREGKLSNLGRQLTKFSTGLKLSPKERYWAWACGRNEEQANYLLKELGTKSIHRLSDDAFVYKKRKDNILKHITKTGNLNEIFYTDMQLVLPNDMLFKADMASMANSLEVRTPFLDFNVVNFAFEIPVQFKINHSIRKKILQDSFKNILPAELYNRPKKGFELPLLSWLKKDSSKKLLEHYFEEKRIESQGIFNYKAIESNLKIMNSKSPGDSASTIWSLLVFQKWYDNYMTAV